MKRVIPFLDWIKSYKKSDFLGDLPAGITVGIILIPQGMAYAMIAGLPPVYGLYAAIFPQIIYAFLGTSRQLSVGPVAMDSLLVASSLSAIAVIGTEHYISLAIVLALLMGIIQLIMGSFRLGFLVNFLSKPVISGFTSAAAIIIAFNQIKNLLGIDVQRSNQVHELLIDVVTKLSSVHVITLFVGAGGIVVIKLFSAYFPKIPGALVVVLVGIIAAKYFALDTFGVSIVGDIPGGLPAFSFPAVNSDELQQLLPIAFTLSLIAFMEAISVAKSVEVNHSYRVKPNQELIALGCSNIIGSLFMSYPTTGGLSRTAVNEKAGAKTGIASLIAAGIIALTLLFFTSVFYYLPNAILAAIIVTAVLGLIDFKYPLRLWRNRKEEFVLLIFTFTITLFVGISIGIISGVVLSLLLLIYRTTKPHVAVLGNFPGTSMYKNISRFTETIEKDDLLVVRFDSQLYFANSNFFREKTSELIDSKGIDLEYLIFSVEGVNFIDSSAASMLRELIKEIQEKGIKIAIVNATGPVRDILKKSGIIDVLPKKSIYVDVQTAVDFFDGKRINRYERIVSQTNL